MKQVQLSQGLREDWSSKFAMPRIHQHSIRRTEFPIGASAISKIPVITPAKWSNNYRFHLDVMSVLNPSDELIVTLHGAAQPTKRSAQRFERVKSLQLDHPAVIAFSDPGMLLDDEILLSWYLGVDGWDPLRDMAAVIENARQRIGANRVLIIGGSGGGFAALRLATVVPNSFAWVQSPQTEIKPYIPSVVRKYFEVCWPGQASQDIMNMNPERFSLSALYRNDNTRANFFYLQNLNDPSHLASHYRGFHDVFFGANARPIRPEENVEFYIQNSDNKRHGPPTGPEFATLHELVLKQFRRMKVL